MKTRGGLEQQENRFSDSDGFTVSANLMFTLKSAQLQI